MTPELIFHTPIKGSSFIEAASYYAQKSRLIITIQPGIPYEYHGVPLQRATGFFKSRSKGKYYNKFIKGKYLQYSEILLQEK